MYLMKKDNLNIRGKLGIVDVLLMFLFVFNVAFVFVPELFRSRVIIGLFGVVVFFRESKSIVPIELPRLFFWIIIGLFLSICTIVVNSTMEVRFIGNSFQNILYLFGAYLLVRRLEFDFGLVLKSVVLSVFIHNILALVMFLNTGLLDFIWSFQHTGGNFEFAFGNAIEFGTRFIGVGIGSFFSGGMISCAGILLCSYLITVVKGKRFIWVFILLFLYITGIFLARIVYVGIALSLVYLVWAYFKTGKLTHLPRIIFVSVLIFIFGSIYVYSNIDTLMNISSFNHAFELVINFFTTGELSTKSTDVVRSMLIFPTELKSLIIGDGKFYDSDGSFYMSTDVGYSRLVYYFGVLGALSYFFIHIYISYLILKSNRRNKILTALVYLLFALLFIGNIKGLVDFNWLMFLFFWVVVKNKSSLFDETIPSYK